MSKLAFSVLLICVECLNSRAHFCWFVSNVLARVLISSDLCRMSQLAWSLLRIYCFFSFFFLSPEVHIFASGEKSIQTQVFELKIYWFWADHSEAANFLTIVWQLLKVCKIEPFPETFVKKKTAFLQTFDNCQIIVKPFAIIPELYRL